MTEVLAIAHFCKGERLLATFKELGCRIVLLSRAELQDKPWPRHLVDEVFFVKDFRNRRDVLNAVSYLHQDRDFKIVAPLDEYAVGTCATVRAHLSCAGLCEGTTRKVRDKLTMRCVAESRGIPIPAYCGFNNKKQLNHLLNSTPGPWMVKPRSAGGSVRIRKLSSADEVWELYHSLDDERSHHLIEQFVEGDVYHVDTVVADGKVLLEVPGRYMTPPFDVWHVGGVFGASTVPRKSRLAKKLLKQNRQIIEAMGIRNGINHAEFLGQGEEISFLEIAARVPGSNLDQLTTAATGIDLFRESAKIQYARVSGKPYAIEPFTYSEAGIVQCLAQEEKPNLGPANTMPEVTWTWNDNYHVGAAFKAKSSKRVGTICNELMTYYGRNNLAIMPASESPA